MPRSPFLLVRFAIVGLMCAGAFSCADVGPATRPAASSANEGVTMPESGAQAPSSAPAEAAEGAGVGTIPAGAAGTGTGASAGAAPGTAPLASLPPAPTTDLVALVLPLDDVEFARAAAAVRDGFLDSAQLAGAKDRCLVIPYGPGGVVPAFATALARGVRVAVGPLVRSDLDALASSGATLPWTLALNQREDGAALPPAIYTFPLSVDSDARVLARRARADGARTLDVVEGTTPVMHRFAVAFTSAWTQ
ncbi:MAG: penicillin-binding protein activator, partial [Casimicrobiaceae bacterium]